MTTAGGGGGSGEPLRCIGEPISWLRLEQLALDELADAGAARAHLARCAACAAAFSQISRDARPLPALPALPVSSALPALPTSSPISASPVSASPVSTSSGDRTREPTPAKDVPWWRRRARWQLAGGLATAAALAAVLLLVRARPPIESDAPLLASRTVRVKGAGAVVVTLVRERGGAITFDPSDVLPGDRWKIQLTCDPGGAAWADVVVTQRGEDSFPLSPQSITCGNAVVLPGAFRITGGAAELCVVLGETAPDRARLNSGSLRGAGRAVCTSLAAP